MLETAGAEARADLARAMPWIARSTEANGEPERPPRPLEALSFIQSRSTSYNRSPAIPGTAAGSGVGDVLARWLLWAMHMASKLLRGIGIVALIGLIGGSFAALAVVKSRLHITVAEEQSAAQRGPDPLALLAADVALVREDVRADVRSLGDGVGTQMQTTDAAFPISCLD